MGFDKKELDDGTKIKYPAEYSKEESPAISNVDIPEDIKPVVDEFLSTMIKIASGSQVNIELISSIWKYIGAELYRVRYPYVQSIGEIEKQKMDLEHKLLDLEQGSKEYIETLECIGNAVLDRRVIKDLTEYLKVASNNITGIGTFLDGMTKRTYSPRSIKYGGDTVESQHNTTIKVSPIPEAKNKFRRP